MSIRVARALGVLVAPLCVLALCGGLAGCAGTERLPQCRGKVVPINLHTAAPARVSETDAH